MKRVLIATQKEFLNIRIFQQHVGLFFKYGLLHVLKTQRIKDVQATCMSFAMKVGLKGMSDLFGIIKDENGVGRFIAIEIKTGKAVQTKEQKNYMKMVRNMGGIYIVGRDVDQVISDIKKELK